MYKKIETTVDQILQTAGITYSVISRGVKSGALGGTTDMDRWECKFTHEKRIKSEEFDFYTGFGLRAPATKDQRIRASYSFQGLTEKDKKGLTSYGRRYMAEVEKYRKPVAPCAASVLNSLLLDSDSVGQSFANWCGDFGYDTDSRKAFDTYESCQANADKLSRVFDHSTIEQLREALLDY